MKKPCHAYDYLYVECQLHAPAIARGFQNGFRKLFNFTELTAKYVYAFRAINNRFVLFYSERFYHRVPELIDIDNNEDLIFRFKPLDRGQIPDDVLMNVNLTLVGFGSSIFTFHIRPSKDTSREIFTSSMTLLLLLIDFTTSVNFRIENILSTQATIYIKYNKTGAVSDRLCSGYIQSRKDSKGWRYFSVRRRYMKWYEPDVIL